MNPETPPTLGHLILLDSVSLGTKSSGTKKTDAWTAGQNMAIDQTLLESVGETSVPCLRFYRWQQPTLSLGYFQKHDDRLSHNASRNIDCVRRASGGGAIVHHHELTYSLTLPNRHRIGNSAGANAFLYTSVHAAFSETLAEFGVSSMAYREIRPKKSCEDLMPAADPFLCFGRRTAEDLIVSGYKVLGSAQRRGKRSLMQHGSLLVRASQYAPELPGVVDLGAKIEAIDDLIPPLVGRLLAALGIEWQPQALTANHLDRAAVIAADRFDSVAWTHRR